MPRSTFLILAATAIAVAGCQIQQEQQANETSAAEEPVINMPAVPRPQPPLDRAALLSAVRDAMDATAAGREMPETVASLDGRQFEVRIRFGCRGPVKELQERWLGWSYDAEARRIRVRAKPTISKEEPLVAKFSGEEYEAVEGFWIPRPWLRQPVCPAAAAVQGAGEQQPTSPADSGAKAEKGAASGDGKRTQPRPDDQGEPVPRAPRIGIAQFFTSEEPRSRRRGDRAYEAQHTLAQEEALSPQGYNLVLSGRLRALPNRGVIQCSASGPDSPPECVISAEFQRVWIEKPGTQEIIAEWSRG